MSSAGVGSFAVPQLAKLVDPLPGSFRMMWTPPLSTIVTQSTWARGSLNEYQFLLVMIAASIAARLIVLNGRAEV